MTERKDPGASYSTQTLKKALASAKVRRTLDELRESAVAFERDAHLSQLFTETIREVEKLLNALDKDELK